MFAIFRFPSKIRAFFKNKKERIEKISQSFLYYGALSALVLGGASLPLPLWAKALFALGLAFLLSLTTVIYPKAKYSEEGNLDRERRLEEAERKNSVLEFNQKNSSIDFKKMEWVLEMNLARVDLTNSRFVDFIKPRDGGKIEVWKDYEREKVARKDRRFSGFLETGYTSTVSISLRDALVRHSPDMGVVEYCLPEPFQSGVSNVNAKWRVRNEMVFENGEYKLLPSKVMSDPHWRIEEDGGSEKWSDWLAETTKEISSSHRVEGQLRQAIAGEADYRMKNFIECCFGCRAEPVERERLQGQETLGALLLSLPPRQKIS